MFIIETKLCYLTLFSGQITYKKVTKNLYNIIFKMLKKTLLKLSMLSIIILSVWLLLSQSYKTSAADNVNVTLRVATWTLTYATWATLNLGSGVASYYSQILSWSWTANAFRVSDMKWTVRSRSAGIGNATAWSFTIPADAFQIKATAATPNFMDWDATCGMTTQLTTSYQYFTWWSQKEFLDKSVNWRICKYWVTPTIQVTIPAYQPIWDYTATITLTSTW